MQLAECNEYRASQSNEFELAKLRRIQKVQKSPGYDFKTTKESNSMVFEYEEQYAKRK